MGATARRTASAARSSVAAEGFRPMSSASTAEEVTTVGPTLPQASRIASIAPAGEMRIRAAMLAIEQARALRCPIFSK